MSPQIPMQSTHRISTRTTRGPCVYPAYTATERCVWTSDQGCDDLQHTLLRLCRIPYDSAGPRETVAPPGRVSVTCLSPCPPPLLYRHTTYAPMPRGHALRPRTCIPCPRPLHWSLFPLCTVPGGDADSDKGVSTHFPSHGRRASMLFSASLRLYWRVLTHPWSSTRSSPCRVIWWRHQLILRLRYD
jgi:hypothetical protein